ncbi:EamA family transporter [Intrasporangium sp. DVR]|uniref:EamA family transporter n=1 Tax=Intrasporangium sp. DVR TaxID=3127867 RepID=UPI00313A61E8
MTHRHPLLGLGAALASSAAFATSGAFAKSLLIGGWTPGAVVTLRITIAAAVLLLPTLWVLRGRWPVLRRSARLVIGYGLTGVAGCQLAYFYAVSHLSVGVALLLEYLAPVLIVGWLWLRHRQAPRPLTVVGVVLAMAGLLLVLDVLGGMRLSAAGVLWGLTAAVSLVLYFLITAQVDEDLPPIALAGSGLAVGAAVLWLASLVGVLDTTRGAATVVVGAATVPWWVPVLVISIVAAAFAYVAGVAAVRMLGAKVASFVALSEVLFAVLFAWLVLAELPTPVQLVGGALIVAGLVAVRADESRGGGHAAVGAAAAADVAAGDLDEDYAAELLPTGALNPDPGTRES